MTDNANPAATTTTTPAATPAGKKGAARQSEMIGQLLVRRGLITPEQLAAAMARKGGARVGDVLVEMGLVQRKDITAALAGAVGIPFAVIIPPMVRPEAVAALPVNFCQKHNVLPLSIAEGWITVAIEDFTNVLLTDEIKRLTGQNVQVLAAEGDNIRAVLGQVITNVPARIEPEAHDDDPSASFDESELEELTVLSALKPKEEETRDLEAAAAGSPIIRLVNRVIRSAVEAGASDIHVEPEEGEFRIRYRIDGELVCEPLRPSLRLLSAVVSRIKIMAGMDISERRLPQDGAIAIAVAERPIELRVSTMPAPLGEKVVMRIVDNSAGVRKLDDLGFLAGVLRDLRRAIGQPNGIVLVTGPTGSGKSTTLYSALAEMANDKLNISSIEDPVEYHLKGINQFQVNQKAGFTFAKALRSLLRQDPDIVMVGEIRDAETAKLATEAALTGHLVLSTLHTNDAPSAVPRIVNMGVEPYLVAAAMKGVLAQRLVRRLCQECKKPVPLPPNLVQMLADLSPGQAPLTTAFAGKGCARCKGTGFKGRMGIHEMLLCDEEMFEAAGTDLALGNIRRIAEQRGMSTMFHDCMEKVRTGAVTAEALYEVVGASGAPEEKGPEKQAA